MVFEFDNDKDASNRSKHGYPLALGWIVLQKAVADIHDPREYMTEFGLRSVGSPMGWLRTGCSSASTPYGMKSAA